ncbi:MAG: GIY-YIG nuclease family protein [Candidatus Saliniplasma sp.]
MVDTGIYLLIIQLKQNHKIEVGALGELEFKKGFYLYVGSAQNGLEHRINRHLRDDKKKHWHIDYLLENAEVIDVKVKDGNSNEECLLAEKIGRFAEKIPNFGSSDCRCDSHLLHHPDNMSKLIEKLKSLYLKDYR